MISWTKLTDDKWIIRYHNGKAKKIETLEKLVLWTLALEVDIEEIEHAILEMNRLDHDYCEFGFWKHFVYSKKLGEKDDVTN